MLGIALRFDERVITPFVILKTVLCSTEPSGNITVNLGLFVSSKSVALEKSSTVIVFKVAVLILPPLLLFCLTGSATLITAPHLTREPASIVVVKLITSPSCS